MNEVLNYKINRIKNKYILKKKRLQELDEIIEKLSDKYSYVAIHNPEWLGVSSATKELFDNTLAIGEIYTEFEAEHIAKRLIKKNYKMIIFSAFMINWVPIVKTLKALNPEVEIKVIWHGSNALLSEPIDFEIFKRVLTLANEKQIDQIAFVKKTMADFYKEKGYNTFFLMNTVKLDKIPKKKKRTDKKVKIGMYYSGNRWVKNNFNQLSAASLIDNSVVDYVAINYQVEKFSEFLKLKLTGKKENMDRFKLLERIAQNDITFYVTFTECAPMVPLESFEVGVPCITGNNHHYWEGTELEKYLVVDKADNIFAIKEKALYCLEHKSEIMKLYKKWKKDYDKQVEKNIKEFLEEL